MKVESTELHGAAFVVMVCSIDFGPCPQRSQSYLSRHESSELHGAALGVS